MQVQGQPTVIMQQPGVVVQQQTHMMEPEPQIPYCSCSMGGGTRTVAIIEIVISVINICAAIFFMILGGAVYLIQIFYGAVNITIAAFLLRGAQLQCASKLMPYLIWKPITLTLMAIGVIVIGVAYGNVRNRLEFDYDYLDDADYLTLMIDDVYLPIISIGCIVIFIGIIFMYIIVQSYKHYQAHPGQAVPCTTTVAHVQQPQSVMVVNQGMPYGSQQQAAYGYPGMQAAPPAYPGQEQGAYYVNQTMPMPLQK